MQHATACRHCNREKLPMNTSSYACALMDHIETLDVIHKAEDKIMETIPCLTFICSGCLRISVFSYLFHVHICNYMGCEQYKDSCQYYTSMAVKIKESKIKESKIKE